MTRPRLLCLFISVTVFIQSESARILAVFPTPLISHQSAHRSIIHELLYRDHEVVLITPLPEYPRGQSPDNLMEIDVSNVTKENWEERYIQDISSKDTYSNQGLKIVLQVAAKVVEKQLQVPEVQSFIKNNETFDLLLLEAWIRPTLFWTYIYDAPVASVSSFGPVFNDYINLGGPSHPWLYPTSFQHNIHNLNAWQKVLALYECWKMDSMYNSLEKEENEIARRLFGKVPPLREQVERIELLLLNIHPVWQGTRPVPKNVVHLGGTHLQDRERTRDIDQELKKYLDSSINGVVYVSFGINIRPRMIPKDMLKKLIRVFSKLPCSVLWKWDEDISELPHNVRLGKWFPQAEVLKHRNVLLFISQCGQQSTDEAIAAGKPILALPLAADQWRNPELLLHHKVGTVLDLDNIREEEFANLIQHTMRNESYHTNMLRMSKLLFDAPASAPIRAVDAIEYVLSNTAGHILSPTRRVPWHQYMEIELLIIVMTCLSTSTVVLYIFLYFAFKMLVKKLTARRVERDSFKRFL